MALLSKQALPKLEAGIYKARIISFEECAPKNDNQEGYVKILIQLPDRVITDVCFEKGFDIMLTSLMQTFEIKEAMPAIELLELATQHEINITIDYTVVGQEKYRNVYYYERALKSDAETTAVEEEDAFA